MTKELYYSPDKKPKIAVVTSAEDNFPYGLC